jgi:hypothetical protein
MDPKETQQFQQILDWLEERLPPAEAQTVANAIPTDQTTQETAEWLQNFLGLSQQMTLARPPASVRSALRHRFDQRQRHKSQPSIWQRVTARLTFDSNRQLAVAGMRATVLDDMAQQLVYVTPAVEVALHVQPRPDEGFDLHGQVFPLAETADTLYAIQLCQNSNDKATTATDDLGEFSFHAISTGSYEMILSSDQVEIIIAPLIFNR